MNKANKKDRLYWNDLLRGSTAASGKKSAAAEGNPPAYSGSEVTKYIQSAKLPDYWPTQDWRTAAPEEHGIDSASVASALDEVMNSNLHSFVLIRNGYIVAEGYSKDWDSDMLHPMYSITKSFTAAACGLAIQEDILNGTDQKVGDFFPETGNDPLKSNITVGQLLSMSSGLEWDNRGERSSIEMANAPDWVKYVLDRKMKFQPGSAFQYNNGNAHLLSCLLQRAIGIPVSMYVNHKLFQPLGIHDVLWGGDLQGVTIGSWALRLRTRDMAKFGLLYLHGGQWDGNELMPFSWINDSVQTRMRPTLTDGTRGAYGYFMWLKPVAIRNSLVTHPVFYAAGSGGQRIFVVPGLNLILAMTGNNQKNDHMPERFLESLLKAVKSDGSLPPNEQAVARLHTSVDGLKRAVDKPE